ncbi:gluconate 2-dehydrogenase subunit 3 family protein [Sulfurimonas sp.]
MTFSRRTFLKAGFLSSTVFLMDGSALFAVTTPIDTIRVLHLDLFPQAERLHISTAPYMHIIFHHSRISKEDKEFIKNGVKWLNEAAIKEHKVIYTKLPFLKRQKLLKKISKTQWGESFLYNIMGYMFEAMLGDPIYGGNNRDAGWQWLAFEGGKPRPKKAFL